MPAALNIDFFSRKISSSSLIFISGFHDHISCYSLAVLVIVFPLEPKNYGNSKRSTFRTSAPDPGFDEFELNPRPWGILLRVSTVGSLSAMDFWYKVFLIVPSLLFVLYLAFRARKSLSKLSNGRSYIIVAYYGTLWIVTLLNFSWCLFQAWECTSGKELAWNILSLSTTSGMLFLEVSLLAFLFQGNHVGSVEALARTFIVSGLFVGLDLTLKGIYLFGFGVPLFILSDNSTHRTKWNLWVIHRLLITAAYGFILFMYHSSHREKLPARPAFYRYVVIMSSLNVLALFACALAGGGAGLGYWLYGATIVCYHAFYLPLLYENFLADFFQEDDLHLENVYYSEMKDAGFFDSDWE